MPIRAGQLRRSGLPAGDERHVRRSTVAVRGARRRSVSGQQRVQAVDLDELLGQPERRAVAVDVVADDAARARGCGRCTSATVLRSLGLAEPVGQHPVPVRVERQVEAVVRQDRRRPLDGVDLRHHRGVHQSRDVEQPVVVPVGVAPPSGGRRSRCARGRTACAASPGPTHQLRTNPRVLDALAGRAAACRRRRGGACRRRHCAGGPAWPGRCRRSASRPTSASLR